MSDQLTIKDLRHVFLNKAVNAVSNRRRAAWLKTGAIKGDYVSASRVVKTPSGNVVRAHKIQREIDRRERYEREGK